MLYVFLVDTGTMLHLDMKLALEKVKKLKETIAKTYKIPYEKQAMLISGGENLDDEVRVCSYSAGTDTNPIFLFTMSSIDCNLPPTLNQDFEPDIDMQDKVDGSLALPPSYQTVVSRAQLAQEFFEQAKKLFQDCELLVHEQHLQQQAWAAVIANLEDVMHSFQGRIERFEETFVNYMETREENIQQLKNFHEDLKLLDKIPILPALMEQIRRVDHSKTHYTLLEWINSKDMIYNLDEVSSQHFITDYVAVQCSRTLSRFDSHSYELLQKDIKLIYDEVNSLHMREVKGLEDRLFRLDQLLHDGKNSLREQGDQAQAFLQNQNRAGNLGDPSILPDLCTSHCKQLQVMLHNHLHLRDIRRRCTKAKEELASNLHARLKWVTYVERTVCEMDSKLHLCQENLKRLKNHLGIMQQAHNAPSLYLEAVAEVVRRRYFTENFQKSATVLAHRAMEVYDNEMQVRRAFMMKIHNHFLYALFTGINDYPPPFAVQPPPPFDVNLPALDRHDIEMLRQILPDMESHLQFSMTVPLSLTPVGATSDTSSVSIPEPAPSLTTGEVLDTFVELQRPGSGDCVNAHSTPAETLHHFNKKSASLRTFSAFGKHSLPNSKGFGIMQVEEDEEGEIKEQESEAETEEFEKVEKITDPCTATAADTSSRNKTSSKADDDEGISEAKQRKLEKSSTVENKKPSVKLVQDRSVTTEGLFTDDIANVAASVSRSKPNKSFLTSLVPRSHSDGEIAHKAINLDTVCGHHAVTSPAESCVLASQDFITAEFFIDESMPSSYTESNGTSGTRGITGGGGSSVAGGSGHTVKSHHVIVAELQRHLEEKNILITTLQDDVVKRQAQLESLEKKLQILYSLEHDKTQQLRMDLSVLKLQAENLKEQTLSNIKNIADDFEKLSFDICRKSEEEKEQALQSVINSLEKDHKQTVISLHEEIHKASEKLQESYDRIDHYKFQLKQTKEQLEDMKQKFTMDVEELKKDFEDERSEEVKKLSLEHELELDSIKEELKALSECKEAEIRHLNETKAEFEREIQFLKRELELNEERLREEFQQEKKQTFEALEAAYLERETEIVKKIRLEAEANLEDKTLKLKQEYEDKLKHAYNECQATVMQYGENIKLEAIQEQHWVWEVEKKKALEVLAAQEEEKRQQMEEKHAQEIAAIRDAAVREKEIAVITAQSEALALAQEREKMLRSEAKECLEAKILEHKCELEAVCKSLAAEKEESFREREKQLCQQAESEKATLRVELESSARKWEEQKNRELEELTEKMAQKHRSEVEGLRSRFRLCVSTTSLPHALTAISSISAPVTPVGLSPMEESPPEDFPKIPFEGEFMPIFKHEALLLEAKQEAHAKAWAEATEQIALKHREETVALMETMKREHDEQLLAMRASILGEKQACFNEAVNRVIREKDKIIEQLRKKERTLLAQLDEENDKLEQVMSSPTATSVILKEESSVEQNSRIIEGLSRIKNWTSPNKDQEMLQSDIVMSSSTIQEAAGGLSASVSLVGGQERIVELEHTLKNREEELKKLQNQLLESSSTAALVNQEKISVLSCNIGDIVLLCYDERHENYLAFLICPTYHFLHMDCLEVLGLKPAAGETRKSWVLAEITEKEYCQTKKAQNRYHVPLGTKFYRIKAKPWDKVSSSMPREEGACGGVHHESCTRRASTGACTSSSSSAPRPASSDSLETQEP